MFKSDTLKKIKVKFLAALGSIIGIISLLNLTITGILKCHAVVVSIVSIIVISFLIVIIFAYLVDEQFRKLENQKSSIDVLKNSNDDIISMINSVAESTKYIQSVMDSDLVDHIFIQHDKVSYLILIFKISNGDMKEYELNFTSIDIDIFKFEVEIISDSKKFKQINFKDVNHCIVGSSINNIKFCVNNGFNIGIIKISLSKSPSKMIKINISLNEKETNKVLINNKEYTIMV